MFNVTILMVGKTREGFIREGVAFYGKRLRPFLQLVLKPKFYSQLFKIS